MFMLFFNVTCTEFVLFQRGAVRKAEQVARHVQLGMTVTAKTLSLAENEMLRSASFFADLDVNGKRK